MVIHIFLVVIYIWQGDNHKGTFSSSSGAWTEQKKLNYYFVMKGQGVKSLHCLDISNSTELLELHSDD